MAKKTASNLQSSLFRREIPRMPDGYYTPGPNPNLRRFVEEHAKPYDPAADDYNVPPFDQPITTTKATAIYNMHTYWSKKPHDAIRQYIRHYTKPGNLVLDPFCGSGGTALAAMMEGRSAIAIDLSPAATFITKNYCTPVDVEHLRIAFGKLKTNVQSEIDWLYETRCDRCDGKATTEYTVYSYVFQCERCLRKIPLFDCIEETVQAKNGNPKKINVCPYCKEKGHSEEIRTSGKKFGYVPVMVSYLCEEGCKPRRSHRKYNDPNEKKREFFQLYDYAKLKEIERKDIPYPFPTNRMMNAPTDATRWGLLWRPYLSDVNYVSDLYTKRNLWALSCLFFQVQEEKDAYIRDAELFALNSIVLINSKMCRVDSTQTANGIYYTPPIFKEIRPDSSFTSKVSLVIEANEERTTTSTSLCISTQSCTETTIPDDSIDYIFTDPPYSWKVQYGEANFVWESWLGLNTKWHDEEIIVNEFRGKGEKEWASEMTKAMKEAYRVLKPGHWISMCYHDSSEGTWMVLQDLMAEVGFIVEKSENILFIDTDQKTWKQTVAEKVTKRDLVINFRKPQPGEVTAITTISGEEDEATFQDKARAILTESLDNRPGATSDRLYDELVSRMVRRGEFQRHNFDELLRSVAEESNGRWYLLDMIGQVDEAESKKESGAAKRLERFMDERIINARGELGVHYSDLFEQYLPIVDKPRRALIEWLPEFFFQTEEGTWRPPKDDEERQAKAGLRASGVLRRIKRFANALAEGVPPAPRDLPGNAATLADWIYQCRRAGLYDLGRILYEKGGLRFDGLDEDLQLQVEEDYQICVRRSEKKEDKTKRKGKKSNQLELGLDIDEE